MQSLHIVWPNIRTILQSFSFYEIKDVSGLAGLDLTLLAHLEQKPEKGASKGQLMTVIDGVFGRMEPQNQSRFLNILTEEILRRKPETLPQLEQNLSRLGWTLAQNILIPIEVFDPSFLSELPTEAHNDLLKAAQRFRDGDLSGAISAACGAVDSSTTAVYSQFNLGDPYSASFQERCKKATTAKGVIPALEQELRSLGWAENEINPFKKNFESSLTQGAFVMQSLRSKMGDVHGTKPILKPMVFNIIKWAELLVRSLNDK